MILLILVLLQVMWGSEPTNSSAKEFGAWWKNNFTCLINSWEPVISTETPTKTRSPALKFDEDVEEYGAKADGKAFSGDAFDKAITACSSAGGGVVHARGGVYITGNIQMRSNVILSIGGQSSIMGSANASHWTRKQSELVFPPECDGPNLMLTPCVPPGSSEDYTCSFPRVLSPGPRGGLFWASQASNFTIRGPPNSPLGRGPVVSGAGEHWNHDPLRSNMFTFAQCTDVEVTDLSVIHSSAWTLVPIFSKRVHFRRLHVGPGLAPFHSNTDGFDPMGSEDCSFQDSYYEGPGDDCVAIKSGIQVNWTVPYVDVCKRPTRNIYVNNVTCVAAHGITIGSEVSGGIEDITFTNMRLLASPGTANCNINAKRILNFLLKMQR